MQPADSTEEQMVRQLQEKVYKRHLRLSGMEIAWRDRSATLQDHGYMLRARYHPDWRPSWQGNDEIDCEDCEDYWLPPPRPMLMDATRISDNRLVYIKRVASRSEELEIALMLGSSERVTDRMNHCVPVLDHFQDPADNEFTYLVMPFLRPIDSPPFELVEDIVDYVDQILEGLYYLHLLGVAHRDCVAPNILMDADVLYPEGYHPVLMDKTPDISRSAPVLPREPGKLKYYYVDFGISSYIPAERADKLVVGTWGRDQDVPELSDTIPYDPFKVDIFIIGHMLSKEFAEKFSNLKFLHALLDSMTAQDPASRPSAEEVFARWRFICNRIPRLHLAWRARPRDETWYETFVIDLAASPQIVPWFFDGVRGRIRALAASARRIVRK